MQFNPNITKQATEIIFSRKKIPIHPQHIFSGNSIVEVKDQKHLGLILVPGLTFSKHMKNLV